MKRITKGGEVPIATPVNVTGSDNAHFNVTGTASGGLAGAWMDGEHSIPPAYPHRLNTYVCAPDYDVTIEQFEEYAYARLQVLRAIDSASMRSTRDDEIYKAIKPVEEKWLPLHSNESVSAYNLAEERRRDHASHFILRLAFCSSPDAIRWFVTQECALLRLRFATELSRERTEFLRTCHAGRLPVVSGEERAALVDGDPSAATLIPPAPEEVYKVLWEWIPDLVSRRAVLVRAGWAYVPKSESFSLVLTKFRESLEFWMERTARELVAIRDERILPLLSMLKNSEGPDGSTNSGGMGGATRGFLDGHKLTADSLEAASIHFPLCVQKLYEAGKRDHHLKYGGRQQLGLFLKGIGLPLEEAIMFWRRLFVPKCGEDGFTKNYLYNVRHNYGQEGKRANYGPTPCSRIITGTAPGVGDHHGCPFRHSTPEALTNTLLTYAGPTGIRLNSAQVTELVEMSRGAHCQAACTRLFEWTRAQVPGSLETFAFPTRFFEASLKLSSTSLPANPTSDLRHQAQHQRRPQGEEPYLPQ